jgi:imidazolonepropionase-like amidohydrolase
VDQEFLLLAREASVFYVPTLMVGAGYTRMYLGMTAEELPYPTGCVDQGTREKLAAGIADSLVPQGLRGREEMPEGAGPEQALENLRRVHEAGITVATGTDAGNPGTLHGPAIHREVELMARAGMTPAEVLVASTRNAAGAMGRGADLGTLEPGKAGDLVILDADPTTDVRNLREIDRVVKGGVVAWPEEE